MDWKLRGRLFGLLLLSISFVSANAGYTIGPAEAGIGDTAASYHTSDNKIDVAQSEARKHLAQLVTFVLEDQTATGIEAGVKVAVPASNGTHKVVWVRPFAERGGRFVGLVASEPNSIKAHNVGQVIDFGEAQVHDWYFHGPKGKMYGSFMTRAMLEDLPAVTAAQISLLLADTPTPANW